MNVKKFAIHENNKLVDNQKLNELLLSKDSNIYFVSDLHFSHFNILKFCAKERLVALKGQSITDDNGVAVPITLELLENIKQSDSVGQSFMSKSMKKQIVKLMGNFLIQQWNDTVTENDIIFFLGDMFATRHEIDYKKKILSQLNGHIIMIEGNHDHDFFSNEKRI